MNRLISRTAAVAAVSVVAFAFVANDRTPFVASTHAVVTAPQAGAPTPLVDARALPVWWSKRWRVRQRAQAFSPAM